MVSPTVVAVVFLVFGIAGSVLPLVPGGVFSIAGVGYYWLATGELGAIALAGFLVVGGLTVGFDWLGGALSAQVGGASIETTAVAAVAGVVVFSLFGPLGAVLGVGGAVFALEYRRHGDARRGLRTAAFTTVGVLASTATQVLLTGAMLVGFLLVVL